MRYLASSSSIAWVLGLQFCRPQSREMPNVPLSPPFLPPLLIAHSDPLSLCHWPSGASDVVTPLVRTENRSDGGRRLNTQELITAFRQLDFTSSVFRLSDVTYAELTEAIRRLLHAHTHQHTGFYVIHTFN